MDRRELLPWIPWRAWCALACLIPCVHFACSLRWPATINSDSAIGFLAWDSMRAGGAWNHLTEPDPRNLARDGTSFVSWWSPGQYLIAAPWQRAGLDLGRALSASTLCCELIGLAGYFALFRHLDFSRETAARAVCLIAGGWAASQMFNVYWGGDIALFGCAAWLMLAVSKARGSLPAVLGGFPLLFLFGAMAKLSFAVAVPGLLLFCYVSRFGWKPEVSRERVRAAALLAAVFVLFYGLLWWTFLRHGTTPATVHGESLPFGLATSYAINGACFSAFSVGSLLSRIFFYPWHPLLTDPRQLGPWLWAFTPLTICAYYSAWIHSPTSAYRNLLISVAAGFTVVFTYFYLSGSAVGLDDRYYRPAGFLLVPGLLCAWQDRSRLARCFLGLIFGASLLYGQASYVLRTRTFAAHGVVGGRGFTHINLTPGALRALRQLDQALPPGNNLIYTPSLEQALELQHQRRLLGLGLNPSSAEISRIHWHGRPARLLVLFPASYLADGRAGQLLAAFVDVPRNAWRHEAVDGWLVYYDDARLDAIVRAATLPVPPPAT